MLSKAIANHVAQVEKLDAMHAMNPEQYLVNRVMQPAILNARIVAGKEKSAVIDAEVMDMKIAHTASAGDMTGIMSDA